MARESLTRRRRSSTEMSMASSSLESVDDRCKQDCNREVIDLGDPTWMRTFCVDIAKEEAYVGASNCKMNDSNRLFRNDTIIVLGVRLCAWLVN